MIHKTIDGYEVTVHPSMEQAAIDQGIRPAGYDSPITDEVFLNQSDPMKVLPPADGEVICNGLGTALMSAKTASELLSLQHKDPCKAILDGSYRRGCKDTVARFIEIIHRRQEEREKLRGEDYGDGGAYNNGYLSALEALECEAMVMEDET